MQQSTVFWSLIRSSTEETVPVWPLWPENRSPDRRTLLLRVVCLSNINLRRDKCWTPPSSWETGEWSGRCSLLKRCPPPPTITGMEGEAEVLSVLWRGEMGVFSTLHEFLSPNVVSTSPLFGQGRAMHSAEMWHDILSMFLSDRGVN